MQDMLAHGAPCSTTTGVMDKRLWVEYLRRMRPFHMSDGELTSESHPSVQRGAPPVAGCASRATPPVAVPLHHDVRFFADDRHLCSAVVDFLATGLQAGHGAVVIATAERSRAFSEQLSAVDIDVAVACRRGQLRFLEARTILSEFMVGGMPDAELFSKCLKRVLEDLFAEHPGVPVRAYGEMVDVLRQAGNLDAAQRLEEMWNELHASHSFTLFCGYRVNASGVQNICAAHSLVRCPPGTPRDAPGRSERLLKVTAAMAAAVAPAQVLDAVVNQVAMALEVSSAGLWLVSEDGATAHLARSVGYSPVTRQNLQTLPLASAAGLPVLDAIRRNAPVWLASQAELIRAYPHLAQVVTPGRSYSIACAPLVVLDHTRGAVAFTFDDGRTLDQDERDFILLVARYSGQAIERLRMLDAERSLRAAAEVAATRAELLYELAAAVIGAAGIEDVFDAALDGIEHALGASRCAVLAFDTEGVMRFRAWRGLSDEYREGVEGHSPWPKEVRAPEPIVVRDVYSDPGLLGYSALFRREGIGALAFVPLVAAGQLIGKFMVYYEQPRTLSPSEIDMAKAIANHVAAAMNRFASVAELEQTVRFNEMFTGMLGHDLRNPLGAIMTAAQIALRRGPGEQLARPLSRILGSGERMARMIDQLLDFTRVRVGAGIPINPEPSDLVPILRQVIDELEGAIVRPAVRLEPASGSTTGSWDSDRISQVFSNLLANALQHGTPMHSVRVRIDGTQTDLVRVEVHNQGEVPSGLLARMFEPMAGGDRRGDKSRGLGLGLYISQQIIKAHGGSIRAETSAEGGTTFSVQLPRGTRSVAGS